jgi:RimJ/RimL family protein N-acetyltransferase
MGNDSAISSIKYRPKLMIKHMKNIHKSIILLLLFCVVCEFNLATAETTKMIDLSTSNNFFQNMSFKIHPFTTKYQSEVIDLIEKIQVAEFNIPIEEGQRKELQSISSSFQKNKGNYWVAIFNDKVIGTIAVIDIGHNSFELRDVFLAKEYRGTGFAKQLLDVVLTWAKEHDVKTIYLGTTLAFRAAHRFYEKHGFHEIARKEMPSYCQPMDCDEKFYQLDL